MSYHRYGLGAGVLPFSPSETPSSGMQTMTMVPLVSTEQPSQPSGDIQQMEMIDYNPMIAPAELEQGDQVMIQTMQMAKTGVMEPLPASDPPTEQPTGPVYTEGPPVTEPMSTSPVIGMSKPMGPIETYVPESGLFPAQPEGSIQQPSPCPPGKQPYIEDGKLYCLPEEPYQPEGPITQQALPPTGQIPTGMPPEGQIPTGTPPTGPIALQYQQQAAAAATAAQPKSSVVPIALAAGAALLLARFLK